MSDNDNYYYAVPYLREVKARISHCLLTVVREEVDDTDDALVKITVWAVKPKV